MDSNQISMIVIFIILIAFSAIFSSAETAFTSVSKIRIRTLAEDEDSKDHKKAMIIDHLLQNPDRLLSTILVGNNVVNIGASSLTTSFVISLFGNDGTGVAIATGFVTLMILIFGEITPKTMANKNAERLCFTLCRFVQVVNLIFTPVVICLTFISHGIVRMLGGQVSTGPTISEEDLKTIVNVSHEEGVLEDEEKEMLHNVFDFADTEIREVMTPRIHVETVGDDISYNELMDVLKECQFSRLPVHSEDYDEIIGVLNIKDLLLSKVVKSKFDITDYMREPFFVYEFNHISDVFAAMRNEHTSLAVVLDEYGVMSGIVTLEDIVEEIVGEIDDEFDEANEETIIPLGDNEYLLDGSLNIDEVNEECGTHFESEDFESIGGLVLGQVNGSPEMHQEIYLEGTLLTIEKIDKNRIEQLKLTILDEEDEEEEEEKHED